MNYFCLPIFFIPVDSRANTRNEEKSVCSQAAQATADLKRHHHLQTLPSRSKKNESYFRYHKLPEVFPTNLGRQTQAIFCFLECCFFYSVCVWKVVPLREMQSQCSTLSVHRNTCQGGSKQSKAGTSHLPHLQ